MRPSLARLAPAAVLLALAPTAAAQSATVTTLLQGGTTLPTGDTLSGLRGIALGDQGSWAAIAATSGGDMAIFDGTPIAQVGAPYDASNGPSQGTPPLESIRTVRVDREGRFAFHYTEEPTGSAPSGTDRIVVRDLIVLSSGDTLDLGPGGPSFPCVSIVGFDLDGDNMTVTAAVDVGGAIQVAIFSGTIDSGPFQPREVLLRGDSLSGSTDTYFTGSNDICVTPDGRFGSRVFVQSGGPAQRAIIYANSVVAVEGGAGPFSGSVWTFDSFPRARFNSSGDSILSSTIQLASGPSRGAIFQGPVPIAIEGGQVVGLSGDPIAGFLTASIDLADDGTPFYIIPFESGVQRLMAGFEVLVETGTTTSSGFTISSLFATVQGDRLDVSSDGRLALVQCRTTSGFPELILVERNIGEPSACAQAPNSTGATGELEAIGSRLLAFNDLSLRATALPPQQFALLLVSRETGFTANPGGSAGNLCLGGAIGRYVNQILPTDASGAVTFPVDLTAIPRPSMFEASSPGDLWRFQAWHRDSFGAGPASCLTEATAVRVL